MALELTSVALFRNYIGDQSADSTLVTTFLNAAEQMIAKSCGRFDPAGAHWISASHTERIDGEWSPDILLKFTPVTAISSVVVTTSASGSYTVDTTLLEMDGIAIASLSTGTSAGVTGRLGYRNNGFGSTKAWFDTGIQEPSLLSVAPNFGGGGNRVVVAYTGGYAAAPDDLILAANILAASMYRARTRDSSLKSEQLGDYSYTLDTQSGAGIPAEVESIIGNYRRILV